MSLVFMNIGRSSPRHQELALLYPRSKDLQAHVNEYFIVVVRFCHEMLGFTQMSAFRQFATTLGGDLVNKTQSDIDHWGNRIKDEMLWLVAKRTEEEAAENSRFRSMSKKFSKSTSQHNKLAAKLKILQECSTFDYQTSWKQIRKSGSTTTFAETHDYEQWKHQSQSCTLLYYGKLGCGKSVTMSNMVDDLNLATEKHHTSVAYFFIRQDLPESLIARTVIGSLVRQLLVSKDELTDPITDRSGSLDAQEMLSLLLSNYNKRHKIHVLLDGLDLCTKAEIGEIVDFVRQMQEELWVLACVSLRQEPDREPHAVYRDFLTLEISSLPDNSSDIVSFVDAELERCLKNNELRLGNDERLILTIRQTLLEGSNGMFLWVALQIKVLCSMETDKEIVEALADLPTDLSETYFRILQKVQGRRKLHQDRILKLITSARLPLTVDEMRDALSVTPGQTDWTNRDTINDVYSTLTTCGCLIHVDEEEFTVRFVHPSVMGFFLRQRLQNIAYDAFKDTEFDAGVTVEECHKTMADTIVTYLNYGVFERRISKTRVSKIEVGGAPSMVVKAATEGSKTVQNLALKLLARGNSPTLDLSKIVADEAAARRSRTRYEFPFLHYARRWCLHHVCAIRSKALGPVITKLLPTVLNENGHKTSSEPASLTAIVMAIEHDNESLLAALLAFTHPFIIDETFVYQHQGKPTTYTPRALAVCRGKERIIAMLQEKCLESANLDVKLPICYIIYFLGYLFLRDQTNDDRLQFHICQSGKGPISCAIWSGDMNVVKILLDDHRMGTDTGRPGHTPIEEAIARRSMGGLEMLLSSERLSLKSGEKEKLTLHAKAVGFTEAVPLIEAFSEVSQIPREIKVREVDREYPILGKLRRRNEGILEGPWIRSKRNEDL
jgi:hypothetical protein